MNLHPGVATLFRYMAGDELTVAELMESGELQSPQKYKNVTLFNIRITGVAVSFRPTLNEWVYRKPEEYLTDRFMKRCNGLPVIWQHPEKSLLTSDEFSKRIIGSVFLPFIRGDEVWAVAKIWDDEAIKLLNDEQLSTSPAVLLEPGSEKYSLADGTTLLVEERASLLDHIAICEKGVWDKGGDPTGVEANNLQELAMADSVEKEVKKDAASFDQMLSGVCDRLDAISKRIDAWDEEKKDAAAKADAARKDAEEKEKMDAAAKADAVKKDAEEKEKKDAAEEKEKKDAAKADADKEEAERLAADKKKADAEKEEKKDSADARYDALQKTIDELRAMVVKPLPEMDRSALAAIQSKADSVHIQLGARAEPPMVGESPDSYRRRMARSIQSLSPRWKDTKLDALAEDVFSNIEVDIYKDALESAKTPSNLTAGSIRAVEKIGPGGHKITDFVGNGAHFIKAFSPISSVRRVTNFNIPNNNH